MIEGLKIIERVDDVVNYTYKGYSHWCKGETFDKMSQSDFEKENKEAMELHDTVKRANDIAKKKPITSSEKAIFERWQSETGE